MPELTIYVRHLGQANICRKGGRAWFAARSWPWLDFLANGRPATDFIETGDPFAKRVVDAAVKEAISGR